MGLFDNFPYTNFHELNLDWILNALRILEHTIDDFVAINALKYADPIQWNITSQYEKNTIVIDPQTGTAYISVQPVPAGVSLTNTDYWTVVFDLGSFVVKASKNFTDNYEADTTTTATFNSNIGDWLVWGDTLYIALNNISIGDAYVINTNIRHFTMEDVIGLLTDLNTTDKSNIVAAINEIIGIIGDLNNLATTDKSSVVAAINDALVISSNLVSTVVGDLANLLTIDKSDVVNAINENYTNIATSKSEIDLLKATINFNKPSYYVNGASSNMQSMGYNSNTNQYAGIEGLYPSANIIMFDQNMNELSTTPIGFANSDLEDLSYDADHDCYWTGLNNPVAVMQLSAGFTVLNTYPITATGVDAVGYDNNTVAAMTKDNTIQIFDVSNGFNLVKTISFIAPFPNGIQGCCLVDHIIYAPSYFTSGDKYTNIIYIIDCDTENFKIQFVDYLFNNAEIQGCFIANGKLNIYGTSYPYSGRCWWLSVCDFYSYGNSPILPAEGSGTPQHIYINEDNTSIGDGNSTTTALNDLKLAVFRLNYGMPNIIDCARLHKGSGETLTFFGVHVKITGDTTAPGYNLVFSNCDVIINSMPMLTYIQFVDHTKAKLKSCALDNVYIADSEVEMESCYFNATAGPNTDTLYVDRGVVKMSGTDAASTTSGVINASIIIGETPSHPMALTLQNGSQHFV